MYKILSIYVKMRISLVEGLIFSIDVFNIIIKRTIKLEIRKPNILFFAII